jgi:hypothetical protein
LCHEWTSKPCPYIWEHHMKIFFLMDGKGYCALYGIWTRHKVVWEYLEKGKERKGKEKEGN